MPELILRDIDPAMLERVRHWADAQSMSLDAAVVALLARGLAHSAEIGDLQAFDARVLQEAIIALEKVPSDPGFALIGRAAPSAPPVAHPPDQAIDSRWSARSEAALSGDANDARGGQR